MESPAPPPWRLDLDAVAHYPRPGTNVPSALSSSPDSRLLTFLFSDRGDLVRDLWAFDVASGERIVLAHPPNGGTTDVNANPEEAMRRERQRLLAGGITSYRWAHDADRLLLPVNGQLYVTTSRGGDLRHVAASDVPVSDARLTPDGRRVVFVRERELWTAAVDGEASRRLTFDATESISNGLAEFIAQEEMGRSEGFWISRDGSRIAYAQVDEAHIREYPIVHQGEKDWRVERHRYPFAGKPNARVRLGVVSLFGGPTRWLDLEEDPDFYLARVAWSPSGRLLVQVESRDQRRLELRAYDVTSGLSSLLLVEESDVWINLHNDLRFPGSDDSFIWSTERSGFRHLSQHAPDGKIVRTLTAGSWPVDGVAHVDEERRVVYFMAGRDSPLERVLFRVSIDGGDPVRISDESGFHSVSFARDGSWYADTYDSRERSPSVVVRRTDGGALQTLHTREAASEVTPGLRQPELIDLRGPDGSILYGAIYRPEVSAAPFPAIVSVYGGPHAQMVTDSWGMTVDLRAQYLASLGFLVFKLDNRGSARRGLIFEGALQRRMGGPEVEDQVAGVQWLVDNGLADSRRVGIYGWSYGGYMTIMCMLRAPDVFRVGVAGAPVTDWDGYDTHYTEHYMDTPSANPDGYRQASALSDVDGLAGKLLIIHGMVDENVHFRHTARLVKALEEAGRPFDLLAFPEERHMPRSEHGRRSMEQRIADHFIQHLRTED